MKHPGLKPGEFHVLRQRITRKSAEKRICRGIRSPQAFAYALSNVIRRLRMAKTPARTPADRHPFFITQRTRVPRRPVGTVDVTVGTVLIINGKFPTISPGRIRTAGWERTAAGKPEVQLA